MKSSLPSKTLLSVITEWWPLYLDSQGEIVGVARSRPKPTWRLAINCSGVRRIDGHDRTSWPDPGKAVHGPANACVDNQYTEKAELLDRLLIAIEEQRAVFLTYRSQRATEAVTYDVYPYRIIDHRGSLYLFGHSPDHAESRTWKVDRMQAADLTEVRFQRPEESHLDNQLAGSFGIFHGHGEVRVRIRFDREAARYVKEKRMHASQQVIEQPDGCAIAEFQLSTTTG